MMCLQLERSSSSMRTRPNWKHNMEYSKRKAGYIFYLYRMCLKPPKSHPVRDVYSWSNLSPQMRDWQSHVNAQQEERRLSEICPKAQASKKSIRSQFLFEDAVSWTMIPQSKWVSLLFCAKCLSSSFEKC